MTHYCTDHGSALEVTHIPSGKSRLTHPMGQRHPLHLQRDMMDSILEELSREAGQRQI